MTYAEFKDACYTIRNNRLATLDILKARQRLEENKFDRLHFVSDPGKERIQMQMHAPDDLIIDAINEYNCKRQALADKLSKLPAENENIRKALFADDTQGGWIAIQFFILGCNMTDITKRMRIDNNYGYQKMKQALRQTYNACNCFR